MTPEIERLVSNYPQLAKISNDIDKVAEMLINAFGSGGKLLLCGNGGSAADCEHIVGELLKEFKIKRPLPENRKKRLLALGASDDYIKNVSGALPAVSLVNSMGYITAFVNDVNADYVFAQQLYALGNCNDILLAISTSGNSPNIVNAAIMAQSQDIKVIGLTGATGGKLRDLCDVVIKVPECDTARIQELHLPIYHTICEIVERYFWGE